MSIGVVGFQKFPLFGAREAVDPCISIQTDMELEEAFIVRIRQRIPS